MGKLFGTNGVRGVFGQDFTLEFAHDLALSLAVYFKKGPILVGYDGRNSSPIIAKVICSALNYCGLDCNLGGLVPTPALEYATKKLGYSGGIMITASHNPPQYNGIKPVASDGVEIPREDEAKIEEIYFKKKWPKFSKIGKTGTESRVISTYINGIKSQVNWKKIKSKKFKVALDLGNGAQATAAPILCKELGCKAFLINEKIDGNFPGRGSEPTPQNLQKLSGIVRKNKAALGIAFDGDGDRSIFCDDQGKILTGDKSALLLANHILNKHPKSKVVTCLNSSSAIETLAEKTKSKVIRTKVGSVEVSRKMVPQKALIGFEENGGFMYGKHNQVRDGCMTLALALDLLASSDYTMTEELQKIPKTYTTKDKVSCTKEQAKKVITYLKKEQKNYDTTDGIKIIFDEKNWVMIRPSGTEPIARIYAEADSESRLEQLMSQYLKKTKSVLGS
ncbi:MAG: phosphoglucosamine mutase [Nitrososphaeria archaeon]|nr:phosphoglucosamine mutase [Nitrososphaeria archaeon]NDB63807.1 phosphoglucosamine mutase [Nitrosopumilaceae archaeon]NDB89850.1 phosphoglucosamine mutase [Nitrososphaerota archaeon]